MERKDKIYTFSVQNEDGTNRTEITRTSNWEGLKPWEQLNMLKTLLVLQSYGENIVRSIRELDLEELEKLDMSNSDVFEEWRP